MNIGMPLPVAWITHPDCARHEIDVGHPESPRRLAAIEDRLLAAGLRDFMERHTAPDAPRTALERAHSVAHVDAVLAQRALGPRRLAVDGDTAYTEHTASAALRAAGAGLLGVDLLLAGRTHLAFCAVRPPGHHAERARAMGFCFLNNVAIAAYHALERGLRRVAILDFDVHYGNGTADIVGGDPRILLLSTYQDPLYPHWRGAPQHANLIDVPLPALCSGAAFRAAVTTHWLPALAQQQPELILVSAGFDAHTADPLADLRLRTDDYRWLGALIRDAAMATAQGRVLVTLEGGYDLDALAASVEAFIMPFIGDDGLLA